MIQAWIIFSLLSAFFDSAVHLLSKKLVLKSGEYLVSISLSFVAFFSCLIWAYFQGIPSLDVNFFLMALFVATLGSSGMVCFMRGLQSAEVSYAVPLLCFGPILTALWAWIFNKETMSALGCVGVLIVLVGTYLLELDKIKGGIFIPIKALYYNQSARLIFLASLFWSFTAVFDKLGVIKSSAVVWTSAVSFFMTLILLVIGIYSRKITSTMFSNQPWFLLFLLGLSYSIMIVLQMHAFTLTNIPYVLSLKKASLIISVLIGSFYFKEQNLKERILATTVMIVGGVVIIIFA